jgi:deazaflavin-dependent oxidoreductase (nitroreductase family)
MSETYLYLTTTGRKTGNPHRIEIWFVEHKGRYYLASEKRDASHWVQNIIANPAVTFSVGTRDNPESVLPLSVGSGRILDDKASSGLVADVKRAMEAKYNWSDGLIVQLEVAGS